VLTRAFLPAGLAIIVVAAASCGHDGTAKAPSKYVPQQVAEVAGVSAEMVQAAITARIDSAGPPSWVTPDRWKKVQALYAHYSNAPLWIQSGGIKERATALLAALDSASTHALKTDRYPIDSIHRVVDVQKIDSGATARDLANADVLLTAAYVGYASDMLVGQVDPRTVSQSWYIPATPMDSALVHTLEDSSMGLGLEQMAPQDSEYAVLRRDYTRYRGYAAQGGWPQIYTGVSMAELQSRLETEGYVVNGDSVVAGLKKWQEHHDLVPDGTIGTAVRGAQRVGRGQVDRSPRTWNGTAGCRAGAAVRVRERSVVPARRVRLGGSARSRCVIVGADYKEKSTPVFSDVMRSVVFRP
jgi:murein L,D-transpeptidase YcbB/YkuD